MRVIGIDGCRAGWLCVALDDGIASHWISPHFEDVLLREPSADLILIDIPIGLLEEGAEPRAPDAAARRLLGGKRASSVFSSPVRPILSCSDYQEANSLSRRLTGKGLAKQTWAIVPKIREVDETLCAHPEWIGRVREVHPELCFWAFAGGQSMQFNKKKDEGYAERLTLLEERFAGTGALLTEILRRPRREVARDDAVDALAAALTGSGEEALATAPNEPAVDARGLPMEMVYSSFPGVVDVVQESLDRRKTRRPRGERPTEQLKPKRRHVSLETKMFEGASGRTYVVHKTAQGSFHVFVEVEAKDAARDCGAHTEANTHRMWKQVWGD